MQVPLRVDAGTLLFASGCGFLVSYHKKGYDADADTNARDVEFYHASGLRVPKQKQEQEHATSMWKKRLKVTKFGCFRVRSSRLRLLRHGRKDLRKKARGIVFRASSNHECRFASHNISARVDGRTTRSRVYSMEYCWGQRFHERLLVVCGTFPDQSSLRRKMEVDDLVAADTFVYRQNANLTSCQVISLRRTEKTLASRSLLEKAPRHALQMS
jgi:hypothetical protein